MHSKDFTAHIKDKQQKEKKDGVGEESLAKQETRGSVSRSI